MTTDSSDLPECPRRLPECVDFPVRHRWPVELRCDAVVLRPLRLTDRREWNKVRERNRAWNAPWDATRPPNSSRVAASFGQMVRALNTQAKQDLALPFAICWDEAALDPARRPTRASRLQVAGQITVSNITWGSAHFAHCGYWIDEALAGRGVVPTALALVTDYCFQVMGLHRMEVNIRPENAKSLRVVEKLGFRDEGLRERYLHIDGDWRDHRSFALCDEDVPDGLLNRYLARDPD
ncbi:GNAT family N-acetyltransferase [Luteococcus japonicus]|uniref:Ribosomal-protein-S5p-alanine acetyltransferase n=1 Tax=Luteococcus japonicus LSP_Lj1 TaxID=1255658 RepID=A0A1R4J6S1_9ACTN|nr:GNAT family protein [Luteococcus japonicus]SJN27778.1 Ribosomal-protein-S5p-alanine acetyltransferase [Luteococcus japonicus LSP_Lj1]